MISLLAMIEPAKADIPWIHGMLLFGESATYASHLPMFHAPHDYQVILELQLHDIPRSETIKSYEFHKDNGEKLFTLVPERMDLTQIIDGTKTEFRAQIFLGHFERGGSSLGPVIVKVKKLIHAHKLDPEAEAKSFSNYLIFGKEGEYFSAHLINSKPSFDAISTVETPYFYHEQHCRTRECPIIEYRKVEDSELPATVLKFGGIGVPKVGDKIGGLFGISTRVTEIIYSEINELSH